MHADESAAVSFAATVDAFREPDGRTRAAREVSCLTLDATGPSHVVRDWGGLMSVMGGNVSVYEEVCEEARAQAFAKMIRHAEALGADGIIGMRYDATEFSASVTEVLASGTAVKLAKV